MSRQILVTLFLGATFFTACARTHREAYPPIGETEVVIEEPAVPEEKQIIAGTLTGEMTTDDALGFIRKHQEEFDACYENEALADEMKRAAYVFELVVPPQNIDPAITLRSRTHPDKVALEKCVTDTMELVDFPAHRGDPLRVDVRIQGGIPAVAGDPIALIEPAN